MSAGEGLDGSLESDRVLGGIALRDGDDYVSWAGHVGYGIRPSPRRRWLGVTATHLFITLLRHDPKSGCAGLTLYKAIRELQYLLAT